MSCLIGLSRTKELIFTARHVLADEALTLGIVNKIVPDDQLMEETEKLAKSIMKNVLLAIQKAKYVLSVGYDLPLQHAIRLETEAEALLFATEDRTEEMTAFMKNA